MPSSHELDDDDARYELTLAMITVVVGEGVEEGMKEEVMVEKVEGAMMMLVGLGCK